MDGDGKHQQHPLRNAVILTMGFFLEYTAFGGLQNLLTSIIQVPHVAATSLATLYAVFAVSCVLFGPPLVSAYGPRVCLIAGFTALSFFCATNLVVALHPRSSPVAWGLLVPAGALVGLMASPLWISQALVITSTADQYAVAMGQEKGSRVGSFNGGFWLGLHCTQVSGNLLAAVVSSHASLSTLMVIYVCCAGCGLVLVTMVRYSPPSSTDGTPASPPSFMATLRKTVAAWGEPAVLALLPMALHTGLGLGWVTGSFTAFYVSDLLSTSSVGYVMLVFGVSDAVSSLTLGAISDRVHRSVVVAIGAAAQAAAIVYLLHFFHPSPHTPRRHLWWSLMAVAAAWGVGDACWSPQLAAMLGKAFPQEDKRAAAFASSRLFQSLARSYSFFTHAVTTPHTKLVVLACTLGATVVGYAGLVAAVHRRQQQRAASADATSPLIPHKPINE